jgi:hypothetical protein
MSKAKAPIGTSGRVSAASLEQDRAAGGREARLVLTDEGRFARASVELKPNFNMYGTLTS